MIPAVSLAFEHPMLRLLTLQESHVDSKVRLPLALAITGLKDYPCQKRIMCVCMCLGEILYIYSKLTARHSNEPMNT